MAIDPDETMNRELHELSTDEAAEVLAAFLKEEARVFATLHIEGIELNYSKQSVVRLFRYAVDEAQSKKHLNGDPFGFWVLRLAYYFGEALRRASNTLEWGTGDSAYALSNQPVIKGFAKNQEAAMVVICSNLLNAVVMDGEEFRRIERAVDTWFGLAANQLR